MDEGSLERKLDRACWLVEEQGKKLDRIEKVLSGEGDTPGMVVRVDRVEQTQKRQGKAFWLLLAAVAGALAKAFIKWPG